MALIEYQVAPGVYQTRTVADADLALWEDVGWTVPLGTPTASIVTGIAADIASALSDPNSPASQIVAGLIGTAVTGLVAAAPQTLNTFQKLATALANDPTFGADMMTQINSLTSQLSGKYVRPSAGIPAADLAQAVQTALSQAAAALSASSAAAVYAPQVSPTFSGTVTVPTPTAGTAAATKAYVDSAVSAGGYDGGTQF